MAEPKPIEDWTAIDFIDRAMEMCGTTDPQDDQTICGAVLLAAADVGPSRARIAKRLLHGAH